MFPSPDPHTEDRYLRLGSLNMPHCDISTKEAVCIIKWMPHLASLVCRSIDLAQQETWPPTRWSYLSVTWVTENLGRQMLLNSLSFGAVNPHTPQAAKLFAELLPRSVKKLRVTMGAAALRGFASVTNVDLLHLSVTQIGHDLLDICDLGSIHNLRSLELHLLSVAGLAVTRVPHLPELRDLNIVCSDPLELHLLSVAGLAVDTYIRTKWIGRLRAAGAVHLPIAVGETSF
jgi:hypothetical protein